MASLPFLVSRKLHEARVRRQLEARVEGGPGTRAAEAPLDAVIDLHHHAAMERLLAIARLMAACVLLVALTSHAGVLHRVPALLVMAAYAAYTVSLGVLAALRPERLMAHSRLVHGVDLTWATVATGLSGGTSSHVFPLFLFVLAAAAYRWGLRRTLLDALLIALVAAAEAAGALAGLTPWPFDRDWFLVWIFAIFAMAMLLGMLSERQVALTFNAAAVGRVMTRVTEAANLSSAVQCGLAEVLQLFSARRALFVAEHTETERGFCWTVETNRGHVVASPQAELSGAEREKWLFPLPPNVAIFEFGRRERRRQRDWFGVALDEEGRDLEAPPPPVAALEAAADGAAAGWRSMVGAVVPTRVGWTGRLLVLDPRTMPTPKLRLGLLQSLVSQMTPVMLQLYLLNGLRERVAARERARIARELHDSTIQSLVGIGMHLDALRRRAEALAPAVVKDITEVRDVLQEEAARTRELMDRLNPVEVDSQRICSVVGDLVKRFSHYSGIDSRLEWNTPQLELTPAQCREIVRVVQEALVNVRRHSAASRVEVVVSGDAEALSIRIADNGRGMGFTGRVSDDALRRGPSVIRERVSALAGALAIDSQPTGTTLQVTIPYVSG